MGDASAAGRRGPGILIAIGGLVFLGSGFTDVGSDVYSADTADEIATALEAARGTWNASNWIGAIGTVLGAAGLFMLGSELGRASQGTRTRRAAFVVRWFGLATMVYLVTQIYNATASTKSLAETYSDPTSSALLVVSGLMWTAVAVAVFVALGLGLLWLPHQRWLGWVVLIVGLFAAVVLGAFLGPSPAYLVLTITGVALAASPITAPPKAAMDG
jgi:hypothetical protein